MQTFEENEATSHAFLQEPSYCMSGPQMISEPRMQVSLEKGNHAPPSKLGVSWETFTFSPRAQNCYITLLDFHNLQHFSEISGKENK